LIGHWLLGAPFTATSMIGFIALAGIIVRNSILLVDFIRHSGGAEGKTLRDVVLEAGAVRFKPILLGNARHDGLYGRRSVANVCGRRHICIRGISGAGRHCCLTCMAVS
jgi:hypothetical protein